MTRPRRGRGPAAALRTVAVAALGSDGAAWLVQRAPAPWRAPWARTNHAGQPVTLLEGPAWAAGAALGLVAAPRVTGDRRDNLLILGTAALGMLDDLAGSAASKGLRGHLGALANGRVTTGAVKLVGLALVGTASAAAVDRGRRGPLTTVLGAGVIAGSANLVNLLDLRPGRALKAVVAGAAPLSGSSPTAAAALGASLGVIGDDLAARSMLGDTGANTAGALLGRAVVERTGPLGRGIVLAVLAGLTLASERVSFSAVIERTAVLRRIDQWGRPPVGPGR